MALGYPRGQVVPSEGRKQVRVPAGQPQGAVMARTYVLENKGLNWSGHTWVGMATEDLDQEDLRSIKGKKPV